MNTTKRGFGRPIAVLGSLLGCACTVLFGKWLGVDLLYQQWDASLWRVGKLFSDIGEIASDYSVSDLAGSMTWLCILLYGLLAATLFMLFLSAKSTIASYQYGEQIETKGFWCTIVLAVVIILTVVISNSVISDQTDGWIDDVLALTYVPFLAIFFAVAGILCSNRIPETALPDLHLPKYELDAQAEKSRGSSFTQQSDESASPAELTPQSTPGFHCVHCGERIEDESYQFCPGCGKTLVRSCFCEECGKALTADMKFCPYCGTRVKLDVYS